MIQSTECHSQSDEEPQCTDLQTVFHHFQRTLHLEEPFKEREEKGEPNEQTVTAKMRSKLLGWLHKLALTTFKFHTSTFITAASILHQYLSAVQEPPSHLQLVGCACLFIASKLKEQVIVAPECYATASCNIYSKKELLQKERAIYSHIDFKKLKQGVIAGLAAACKTLQMEQSMENAMDMVGQMMKEEWFWEWRKGNVVCAVLSFLVMSSKRKVGLDEMACLKDLI